MAEVEVSCPSGLRGIARGMKVREEQFFTDRKLVASGKVVTKLLSSCWIKTEEMGPYNFDGDINWEKVMSVDRTAAIIQVRIASFGADYVFEVACRDCRKKYGWGLDLNDLPTEPVSEEAKDFIRTGEPYTIILPDGRHVMCRPLDGEDEVFFAKLGVKDESRLLTYNLAKKVIEMEGATAWRDILGKIEDLDLGDADFLWDEVDAKEGGIDIALDTECPHCGTEQRTMLPFDAAFFSSRKRFATTKTRGNG